MAKERQLKTWLNKGEQPRIKEELAEPPRKELYPFIPLEQSDDAEVEVEHSLLVAIQYEIYIPAKVWDHRAVRAFRDSLFPNGFPGATILKTATGLWEGKIEDTHIYRTIVMPNDRNAEATLRRWLQEEIGKMMAILAEWFESRQEEVWFTETKLHASKSKLITPVKPQEPREPKPLKNDDDEEG